MQAAVPVRRPMGDIRDLLVPEQAGFLRGQTQPERTALAYATIRALHDHLMRPFRVSTRVFVEPSCDTRSRL